MPVVSRPRPVLRGQLHLAAALIAPFGLLWLLIRADAPAEYIACAIFGAAMITLFLASATYHVPPWPDPIRRFLGRVDRAAIFLFVAAAYTPFCLVSLPSPWGIVLLSIVTSLAATGAVLVLGFPSLPRWINLAAYLSVGWVAILATPIIIVSLSFTGFTLVFSAGLLYSLGAVVHAARRPDPWPAVFGHHELFHVATIAATAFIYVVIHTDVLT